MNHKTYTSSFKVPQAYCMEQEIPFSEITRRLKNELCEPLMQRIEPNIAYIIELNPIKNTYDACSMSSKFEQQLSVDIYDEHEVRLKMIDAIFKELNDLCEQHSGDTNNIYQSFVSWLAGEKLSCEMIVDFHKRQCDSSEEMKGCN